LWNYAPQIRDIFGLQERGTLRKDAWADVTLLDSEFSMDV